MKLPDFDQLFELAGTIGSLTREVGLLEIEIEFDESRTVKTVSTSEEYFVSDAKGSKKPAAMNYIQSVYAYGGVDGSLIEKRKTLAVKRGELKKSELTLRILQMQVDVYRTESANNRGIS